MKKAFTLIELLIVIAIIGILAGILFVSIGTTPLQRSRDSKRVADLQNLRTALALRYADVNSFPADTANANFRDVLVPTYMSNVPKDARNSVASGDGDCTTTPNVPVAPTGSEGAYAAGDYGYTYANASGVITLSTCLENATNNPVDTGSNLYQIQFQ